MSAGGEADTEFQTAVRERHPQLVDEMSRLDFLGGIAKAYFAL